MTSGARKIATEIFLTAAGPALVKNVAHILELQGIPVMPLKGVLLQKLVYGRSVFRRISDVDLLVPTVRFGDAICALDTAGFTEAQWEAGGWQVTLKNPAGPPLGVDLHQRLSRTIRSRLTTEGLFARGTPDTTLFDTRVILPCVDDLFAHLLLHATLHWINVAKLHRPEDFAAVAKLNSFDPRRCAAHLRIQGLAPHARLMLPLIAQRVGDSLEGLRREMAGQGALHDARARATALTIHVVCSHFRPGHPARRLAGLALAPSLSVALVGAGTDRLGPPSTSARR